jgi:Fe-S-cluster-containing dehydrogenase component
MDLTLSRIQADPSSENHFQLRVCLQCEQCPSSEVCPNGAFQWDKETGVVKILKETCDGCGLCISECPFSSIFEGDRGVLVCDICDGSPKCVEVCQKQAILFI